MRHDLPVPPELRYYDTPALSLWWGDFFFNDYPRRLSSLEFPTTRCWVPALLCYTLVGVYIQSYVLLGYFFDNSQFCARLLRRRG
jgi:hypothetical protein